MDDVDREKIFDSRKNLPPTPSPDPSPTEKELLILQSRLEKATGDEREKIKELIAQTRKRENQDQKEKP